MAYSVQPLPFERNALAPKISEETVNFHYDKHHKGYATKLNGMVADKDEFKGVSLEKIFASAAPGPIYNCAGQIINHDFYWKSLRAPTDANAPNGKLAEKINADFGSFEKFRAEFSAAAAGHFGSGWAWLVLDKADSKAKVVQTHDAANPVRDGLVPLMTCDVWEHAFYIDYRNDKAAYVNAFFDLVNWDFATANLSI